VALARAGSGRVGGPVRSWFRCSPRVDLASVPDMARLLLQYTDRGDFLEKFMDHLEVEAFIAAWWPQVDLHMP